MSIDSIQSLRQSSVISQPDCKFSNSD